MEFIEKAVEKPNDVYRNLKITETEQINIKPTFFVSTELEKLVTDRVRGKIVNGVPSGGRSATFPNYSYKFGDKTYLLDVKGVGLVKNAEFFGGKKGFIYNAEFMTKPIGGQDSRAITALNTSRECYFDGNGFIFEPGDNFYIAPVVMVVSLPTDYAIKISSLRLDEKFPTFFSHNGYENSLFQEKRLLPSTIRMSSPRFPKLINSVPKTDLDKFMKNFVNTSLGLFLIPVSSSNKYDGSPHKYFTGNYYEHTDSSPCADAVVDKNGICHFVDLEEIRRCSFYWFNWKERMGEINREMGNTLFPEILDAIKMVRKRNDGKEPKKEECIEELIETLENVENPYVRFKAKPGEKMQVTIKNPRFHESCSLTHNLRDLVE